MNAMRLAFANIRITRDTNMKLYRRVVIAMSRQDARIEAARARRKAEKAKRRNGR